MKMSSMLRDRMPGSGAPLCSLREACYLQVWPGSCSQSGAFFVSCSSLQGRCQKVWYCSRAHQASDRAEHLRSGRAIRARAVQAENWKVHKKTCNPGWDPGMNFLLGLHV